MVSSFFFFFFLVVWKILLYVKVYCAFARTGQVVMFFRLPRLGSCFTVPLLECHPTQLNQLVLYYYKQ